MPSNAAFSPDESSGHDRLGFAESWRRCPGRIRCSYVINGAGSADLATSPIVSLCQTFGTQPRDLVDSPSAGMFNPRPRLRASRDSSRPTEPRPGDHASHEVSPIVTERGPNDGAVSGEPSGAGELLT